LLLCPLPGLHLSTYTVFWLAAVLQVWLTGGVLMLAAVIAGIIAVLDAALVLPTLASEQVGGCGISR
jgi:hypothetical protein